MNERKMIVAALLGLAATGASLWAAEGAPAAAEAAPVPAQTVTDGGVEVAQQVQTMPPVRATKKAKNAKQALTSALKARKWVVGKWDPEKKRVIVVESADVDTPDPSKDPSFLVLRDMAVKRAILQAKAKIIEQCNTKMDAMDMVHTPGTDLNKQLSAETDAIEAALVEEKNALAGILERYNQAEAAELRGTTFADRLDDMMAAVIKKIDTEYNKDGKDE